MALSFTYHVDRDGWPWEFGWAVAADTEEELEAAVGDDEYVHLMRVGKLSGAIGQAAAAQLAGITEATGWLREDVTERTERYQLGRLTDDDRNYLLDASDRLDHETRDLSLAIDVMGRGGLTESVANRVATTLARSIVAVAAARELATASGGSHNLRRRYDVPFDPDEYEPAPLN